MILPHFDLSAATWRARAIRYLVIYLLLALMLVGARLLTQDVRPSLRAAQDREAALTTERDELELRVQALSNPQHIRDWALQNGMRRFAETPKTTQDLSGLPAPAPVPAQTTLEVTTVWK
ncbi:hypothetical protein E5F05_11940 [Deinococcus metallilatus]|uniref:Uncharacterized protein n=2 Tax=Deinococcus TaxID=1298 RepID=A0AAJ5F0P6_9DEIO|nr:hypothetical protein [Deinococcus metallilatus]MBB5295254.1 hypothetical protein [Deinococcus metallilatus]QBY08585.1 hypothetical protein E5F05_11940 [Deinococcus metallilatus]RXJ10847.1 hypothetical protein ERJ73_10765 [Deinococcus metallilatus]TLK22182.1 hypothetical protein FCS05_18200 [Deinococcus metallilatus]GMA15028.1 hypothetical protein GCM10025871_13590 [Deinococcus metallilatus]